MVCETNDEGYEKQQSGSSVTYNDPYAIASLIFELKKNIPISYNTKFGMPHAKVLESRKCGLTEYSLLALFKIHDGTDLPKIYFSQDGTLSTLTKYLGLGSWYDFTQSLKSIVTNVPKILPANYNGTKHQYYQEFYLKWKDRIEVSIGVKPADIVIEENKSVETNEEMTEVKSVDYAYTDTEFLHKKKRFFVGEKRRKDIEEQALYLTNPEKPLVIAGMAGIGKTNFAEALMGHHQIVETYGAYRFIIYCESQTNYSLFLSKFYEAIQGPAINPAQLLENQILSHLKRLKNNRIILLDNFDTCYENYFWEVKPFLETLQGLATIVYTMRSHIGPQQLDYILYSVPKLTDAEAVDLFNYHSNGKFKESEENQKYIKYFVGDTAAGCLPLALKLIAKQAEAVSILPDLFEEWKENRIEVMQIEGSDHKDWNLILSISFSFNSPRLKDQDRSLLKALCEFPAPLMGGRALIREKIDRGFNMVNRLIGVALVEESSEGSLEVHPMIREYMRQQSLASKPYVEIITDYYLDSTIRDNVSVIARLKCFLTDYWENIYNSLERSIYSKKGIDTLCIIAFEAFFKGYSNPIDALLKKAIQIANGEGWIRQEANCLSELADYNLLRFKYDEAVQNQMDALALFDQISDTEGIANSLRSLGLISDKRGKKDQAMQYYIYARERYHQIEDFSSEADCLITLGEMAFDKGYNDKALKYYDDARYLYQQQQRFEREADCLKSLGDIAFIMGNNDDALKYNTYALDLYGRDDNILGEADCMKNLGNISSCKHNYGAARHYYNKALQLYSRAPNTKGEADCLKSLAAISLKGINNQDDETLIRRYDYFIRDYLI